MTFVTNTPIDEQRKHDERFTELFEYVAKERFVALDLARMFIGKKISSGEYRSVYEYGEERVIKIAPYRQEANILEYQIWKSIKDTRFKKWFAPCFELSPSGHFLIQQRVRPVGDKDKLPKNIPVFFEDVKKTNFGFIGEQLVCIDYNFINVAIDTSFLATKKAVWKP